MAKRNTVIKWLNRIRGFGIIEADSDSVDVFVEYGTNNSDSNCYLCYNGDYTATYLTVENVEKIKP